MKRVKAAALCSECPAQLVNADGSQKPAGTKTCSASCRQARARRIKRAKSGGSSKFDADVRVIAAAVRDEVKDAAHDIMVDELRPIVREAMTKDVLVGIDKLIKLTPAAIEKLEEQMGSDDETISQRAVTLLLKYTMGNPSVAPPPTQQAPAPMSVVFNVPRPGDTTLESSEPSDAEELRQCTDCLQHKSGAEFVGASPRCQECFDSLHATLEARFAKDDPSAPS